MRQSAVGIKNPPEVCFLSAPKPHPHLPQVNPCTIETTWNNTTQPPHVKRLADSVNHARCKKKKVLRWMSAQAHGTVATGPDDHHELMMGWRLENIPLEWYCKSQKGALKPSCSLVYKVNDVQNDPTHDLPLNRSLVGGDCLEAYPAPTPTIQLNYRRRAKNVKEIQRPIIPCLGDVLSNLQPTSTNCIIYTKTSKNTVHSVVRID